ncbi:MAG: hypothetical protein QM608_02195 [Caulobacter sp.]
MTAALVAFFTAKNGERNKISGIGWFAAALTIVAGGFTLYDTHQKQQNAKAAGIAAANNREEVRTLQLRQMAVLSSLIAGSDLAQPLSGGSFYFDVGRGDEEPIKFDDFAGPFPQLQDKERARLEIEIPETLGVAYDITPIAGGLRLVDAAGETPPQTLNAASLAFSALGSPEAPPRGWSSGGEDYDFAYFLDLKSDMPLRGWISRLAQRKEYGRLVLHLPGASTARRDAIVRTYAQIPAFFVLAPRPQRDGATEVAAQTGACVTRLRVPMKLVLLKEEQEKNKSPDKDEMVFVLTAEPVGFDTEICGWTP